MVMDDLQHAMERADRLSAQLDSENRARLADYVADLLRQVGREPRGVPRRFGATLKAFLAASPVSRT